MNIRITVVCLTVASLLIPAAVIAQPVPAGFDLLETTGGGWDFGFQPIPADFFGPGSDPFTGNIGLVGDPLISVPFLPTANLGNADTIVERQGPLNFPGIPTSDTVPIEIVELSLVSIVPITVTFDGGQNPEQWDVRLDISPNGASSGTMTATKTHANGGTYDSSIFIQPKFTFVRVSDSQTMVLDGPLDGYNDTWVAFNVPWDLAPNGVICLDNIALSHNGAAKVPSNNFGGHSGQDFTNGCPAGTVEIPTLSEWAMILVGLAMLSIGVFYIARRRRTIGQLGI